MQLSLCTPLPNRRFCNQPATKPAKIPDRPRPDKPTLVATLLPGSSLSPRRRSNDVDCLSTPCPKCAKRSLVRRSHSIFDCLNCNFHKQLPPIRAGQRSGDLSRLEAPRTLEDAQTSHRPSSARLDSRTLAGRKLGQGSLSRLLETDTGHLNFYTEAGPPAETEAAQPLIFAVISVIIGILIL